MSDLVERLAGALYGAEYPDGSYEGFRAHAPDGAKYERMAHVAIGLITASAQSCGICGCAVYPGLPTKVS